MDGWHLTDNVQWGGSGISWGPGNSGFWVLDSMADF